MAKNKYNIKMFLMILFPLIVSIVIDRLIATATIYNKPNIGNVADFIIKIWKYACIVYWYWVGKKYGGFYRGRTKSFILGNVLWGIGFVFYIIIFFLTDSNSRINFIKVIPWFNQLAQGYSLGFVRWSSLIISLFTKNIESRIAVIVSYVLMLIVFSIGFYNGKK
ncbi:hypothetical protein [Anaerosalibacter sp. Marseille-P3206]|uniref:hypothetical protein n=1 Tax=Anaerosalibacter sp. Marseille-P3206 TaxID=1871005 RepID=UPI000985C6C2|nr:hypothetical protein [Anaerosalibacter sp. Marseille-P3206]